MAFIEFLRFSSACVLQDKDFFFALSSITLKTKTL
jgi:hypothetical protein